jgi:proteasome assembly chaperone 3
MQVPLFTNDPNRAEHFLPPASDTDETSLLPLSHLTASTLLGGSNPEREMVGQLYATQIASAIVARNPEEKRTVLVGLGLEKVERSREAFFDLVELVGRVL